MMHNTERGEGNFIIWQLKYFRSYVIETLSPRPDYYNAPIPSHFKPLALIQFFLFSAVCFLLTFFSVRILFNFVFSLLLRINDINHSYGLFTIDFHVGNNSNWTEGVLLFSHTIPYLVFLVIGILLPNLIRRVKSWPFRLLIAWFSLNLVIFFIASILKGLVLYEGLGVALAWFISNIGVRILIGLVLVFMIMIGVTNFGMYFLQSAPHIDFTKEYNHIRSWFTYSVLLPLSLGFIGIFMVGDISNYIEFSISLAVGLLSTYVIFKTTTRVYVARISEERPLNISLYVTIPVLIFILLAIIVLKSNLMVNYTY